MAAQYRVVMDGEAEAAIAKQAAQVDDPALMTRGGLFLRKLAQRVTPHDLDALYHVLSGAARDNAGVTAFTQQVDLDAANDDLAVSLAECFRRDHAGGNDRRTRKQLAGFGRRW